MMFVVELHELRKRLPRPIIHFLRRAGDGLCPLRLRLAFFGLLGLTLDWSFDAALTRGSGALASLCGVLSAAGSALLGLLCDAGVGLFALFSDDANPASQAVQRLSVCFDAARSPFEICSDASPFPAFSRQFAAALLACALLLFGCSRSRAEAAPRRGGR